MMEHNDFLIDEDSIRINDDEVIKEIENQRWESLLDRIEMGDVIPIIGNGFKNLHPIIIRAIVNYLEAKFGKKIEEEFTTLSKLAYYCESKQINIYPLITNIITCNQFKVPDVLHNLLSIKQFPLILTTTFDYIVENATQKICEKVSILNFSNNPNGGNDDIDEEKLNSESPVVYHLFGRAQNKSNFVVTEEDLLNFSRTWLSSDKESHPRNLSDYLKNKYLLFLGCEYEGWLFRFFWLSLKRKVTHHIPSGLLADSHLPDENLSDFLERTQTSTYENIVSFTNQLVKRWNQRKESQKQCNQNYIPSHPLDIFISYAHEDRDFAIKIRDLFEAEGLYVWFDERKLKVGDILDPKIIHAIKKAKVFLPIISEHTLLPEEQLMTPRYYRKEWKTAIAVKYGALKSIIPLCISDTPSIIEQEDMHIPLEMYDPRSDTKVLCFYSNMFHKELSELAEIITKNR